MSNFTISEFLRNLNQIIDVEVCNEHRMSARVKKIIGN